MLSMGFPGWNPFALSHGLNLFHDTFVNLRAGVNMTWDTTMPLASIVRGRSPPSSASAPPTTSGWPPP